MKKNQGYRISYEKQFLQLLEFFATLNLIGFSMENWYWLICHGYPRSTVYKSTIVLGSKPSIWIA